MTTFRTPADSVSGSPAQRDQTARGDAHVSRRLPAVAAPAPNVQAARAVTRASARLAPRSMGSPTRAIRAERVATNG